MLLVNYLMYFLIIKTYRDILGMNSANVITCDLSNCTMNIKDDFYRSSKIYNVF